MFDFLQKSPKAQALAAQAAAAETRPRAPAHFGIIGLASVRKRHGSNWEVTSAHVHRIVGMIIRQHLRTGESFDLLPPDQYVVTFLRPTGEATAAVERIREKIAGVFLRDAAPGKRIDIVLHPDTGGAPLPAFIEFPFRPVWGPGKDRPDCFCIAMRRTAADGVVLEGYDVLQGNGHDGTILELDLRLLRKLRIAMNATLQNCGTPARMLCPVHYRTLADERRAAAYAEAFAALHENGISNYVSLQIAHMPRKLAQVELDSIIHAVRCMTEYYVVMAPLDRNGRDGLARAGVNAVGLDLSPYLANPPADLRQRMAGFAATARGDGMRAFVTGLGDDGLVEAAKEAGFAFMCGPALPAGTGTVVGPCPRPPCAAEAAAAD